MNDIIMERSALRRTHAAIARGKITIGFVGGSITDPEKADRWSDKICNWFVYHFPGLIVNVENAAKGATGSAFAIFRVDQDIIPHGCDLIFWECAVNDDEPPHIRRRLREGVLRKLLMKTEADIVPVYTYCQKMYGDYLERRLPETIQELEALAEHYHLNSVNMGRYGFETVRKGRMRWTEWLPDGLHPEHRGSSIYAEPVVSLLESAISEGIKNDLPEPLYEGGWYDAYALDLDAIERIGPWRLNREYRIPTVNRILFTASMDARLKMHFYGTGLMIFVRTNFETAGFKYCLDGSQWETAEDWKPEWAKGAPEWVRCIILATDLSPGEHILELHPVWGEDLNSCGTDFSLCNVGILI